ncbi:hypothetical protein HU200_019722 [Digitaria exilis]|uniref:PIR2-like helical domain-containing protein n=1 Tax=Digitaria exilis TaxID=1010633 RepID=A0A835F2J9_9POAL|nr:hypothetical protein HU200_019722 [Digitaria exilis]
MQDVRGNLQSQHAVCLFLDAGNDGAGVRLPCRSQDLQTEFGSWIPPAGGTIRCRSRLLRKIHAFYLKATKRLHVTPPHRRRTAAAGRFVGVCGGLCFGLLDPVSNIVVNTLLVSANNEGSRPATLEDLKRRSLDAMVAFLTRMFPDLAECQALRYLRLAGADLLVAARIVASDVGLKRFDEPASRPAATESLSMALKCAALAAGADDLLVDGWKKISTHADEVLRLLGLLRGALRRSSSIGKLARLLLMLRRRPQAHAGVDLWWAWQLAACRSIRPCDDGVPFRHTPLLIRTLQDAIHGFYLQALARLPSGELRSRFHRSLLKGGHCYGPLDPVSNIIVNTVWYDAAFPRTHELDMDVIGTRSIHRLENQSLYGMASFLCTRYHSIDFHEAVCFLLEADANLLLADPNLDSEGTMASVYGMWGGVLRHGEACLFNDQDHLEPDTGVQEAFLAAAMAAQHCNPDAQVKLLTSCKEMLGPALSLLQGGGKLSSEDVHRLAMLLCPESPRETKPLLPLPLTGYPRAEVADAHTRITKKVRAVLNSYEQMPNRVGSHI